MICSLKKARPGDERTLAHIQTESWKAAFRHILAPEILDRNTNVVRAEAMYHRLLENRIGNGYLMTVDERPHCIAWWDATREPDMPGYAELICIHSLPDRWNMGHGSMMMVHVLEEMKATGYKQVMLWVFAENTPARRFYEKHGFVPNGREKTGLGAMVVCYEKTLI